MNDSRVNLAGQWVRFANSIVDMISIIAIWILLSFGLNLLGFDQMYEVEKGELITIIPLIIAFPTFWGYYLLTEFYFQRTLGKILTKTKVVTQTGDKPNFTQILWRTLSRSIPFEYFSYLVTINGIHDRLSGTRVIKE